MSEYLISDKDPEGVLFGSTGLDASGWEDGSLDIERLIAAQKRAPLALAKARALQGDRHADNH